MKRRWPHDGVYARIAYSRTHGVGVRAIRDIPAGTRVFRRESERVVWVSRAAVRRLPTAIRQLYEDFGMVFGEQLGVPPTLNMLSVGWYVNHSNRPNVEAGDDGRFRTLRRIRKGEELTADYRTFTDEESPFQAEAIPPYPKGAADTRASADLNARGRSPARAGKPGTLSWSRVHALTKAVFFHRLGELRDRTHENQRHRASGLNFVVAAIVFWNTVYFAKRPLRTRLHCALASRTATWQCACECPCAEIVPPTVNATDAISRQNSPSRAVERASRCELDPSLAM